MQVDRPARSTETAEWALMVVGGPSAGTRLTWDRAEMVLGREAVGAALFRGDPAVSRRHAVLRILDGTCIVEDHSSKNGTFVNDVPIDRPTVLGPEDELRIGSTRLRLAPALGDTALLAAIPTLEPEAAEWDGTASGVPTAPSLALSPVPPRRKAHAHKAGKLALSVIAAIAGTILASALNGSPQLRLAAAALGSAVPAFMTEPGRYQRARVTAMVVLMAGALFVTYGGATLFSYLTDHAAVYPVPPVVPPPAHKATPTPKSTPTGTPTWPTPTPSTALVSPTPTAPASPTPSPTSSIFGTSNMPPPTPTPSPTGP